MKKKRTGKETNSTPEYDSKREQNVLLEQIHSDIKVLAGGYDVNTNRLDNVDQKLDNVESELGIVKMAVIENSKGIKILKDDVTILKDGVRKLESNVCKIDQKLDVVVNNHEQRIRTLEEKTP